MARQYNVVLPVDTLKVLLAEGLNDAECAARIGCTTRKVTDTRHKHKLKVNSVRPKDREIKVVKVSDADAGTRVCMKCRKDFWSHHFGHRLCDTCKTADIYGSGVTSVYNTGRRI